MADKPWKPTKFWKTMHKAASYMIGGPPPYQAQDPGKVGEANTVQGVDERIWFGPGQPVYPLHPNTEGRRFSYPVWWNTRLDGERDGEFPVATLRSMSTDAWQIRGAIETRKDQIARLKWGIRPKDKEQQQAARKKETPAMKEVRELLEQPEPNRDWSQWIRPILEDHFVLDWPSVYMRREGGKIKSLDYIDGGSIRPLLDDKGRTPIEGIAYRQFLYGVPANYLSREQLLVYPHNPLTNRVYPMSHVEQVGLLYSVAVRREISRLQWFTDGTIPDGLLEIDTKEWTPKQAKEWEAFWEQDTTQTGERRKLKMAPGKYVPTKEAILKDNLDEWLIRSVLWIFSLSPAAFVDKVNRATAEMIQSTADDEGRLPLMTWITAFMNKMIQNPMYMNHPEIEFFWELDEAAADAERATADETDVRSGVSTLDEVRIERGKEPYGIPAYITTPAGIILVTDFKKFAETGELPRVVGAPAAGAPIVPGQTMESVMAKAAGNQKKKLLLPLAPEDLSKQEGALASKIYKALKAKLPSVIDAAWDELQQQRGEVDVLMEKASVDWATLAAEKIIASLDFSQLSPDILASLGNVAEGGVIRALAQFELPDPDRTFSEVNPAIIEYTESRAGSLITEIPSGTLTNLRDTLVQSLKDGDSRSKMADRLTSSHGFSEARAKTIANTELKKAASTANREAWTKSGAVTGKIWLLSSAHPETDVCDLNAQAGEIALNEPFPSGDMEPGAHPECLCAIAAVVEGAP